MFLHDHDCDGEDCGSSFSLYRHIDQPRVDRTKLDCEKNFLNTVTKRTSQVRCLNEQRLGSSLGVFRPWELRLQQLAQPLQSNEDDTELLVHVP